MNNWEEVAHGIQKQLGAIVERLDTLAEGQKETNVRLNRLEGGQAETNVRLNRLEGGQAETNVRLNRLEGGQAETNVRLQRIEEGQQGIGTYLKSIDVSLESNNAKLFWLEHRVDAIEKRLDIDPQEN